MELLKEKVINLNKRSRNALLRFIIEQRGFNYIFTHTPPIFFDFTPVEALQVNLNEAKEYAITLMTQLLIADPIISTSHFVLCCFLTGGVFSTVDIQQFFPQYTDIKRTEHIKRNLLNNFPGASVLLEAFKERLLELYDNPELTALLESLIDKEREATLRKKGRIQGPEIDFSFEGAEQDPSTAEEKGGSDSDVTASVSHLESSDEQSDSGLESGSDGSRGSLRNHSLSSDFSSQFSDADGFEISDWKPIKYQSKRKLLEDERRRDRREKEEREREGDRIQKSLERLRLGKRFDSSESSNEALSTYSLSSEESVERKGVGRVRREAGQRVNKRRGEGGVDRRGERSRDRRGKKGGRTQRIRKEVEIGSEGSSMDDGPKRGRGRLEEERVGNEEIGVSQIRNKNTQRAKKGQQNSSMAEWMLSFLPEEMEEPKEDISTGKKRDRQGRSILTQRRSEGSREAKGSIAKRRASERVEQRVTERRSELSRDRTKLQSNSSHTESQMRSNRDSKTQDLKLSSAKAYAPAKNSSLPEKVLSTEQIRRKLESYYERRRQGIENAKKSFSSQVQQRKQIPSSLQSLLKSPSTAVDFGSFLFPSPSTDAHSSYRREVRNSKGEEKIEKEVKGGQEVKEMTGAMEDAALQREVIYSCISNRLTNNFWSISPQSPVELFHREIASSAICDPYVRNSIIAPLETSAGASVSPTVAWMKHYSQRNAEEILAQERANTANIGNSGVLEQPAVITEQVELHAGVSFPFDTYLGIFDIDEMDAIDDLNLQDQSVPVINSSVLSGLLADVDEEELILLQQSSLKNSSLNKGEEDSPELVMLREVVGELLNLLQRVFEEEEHFPQLGKYQFEGCDAKSPSLSNGSEEFNEDRFQFREAVIQRLKIECYPSYESRVLRVIYASYVALAEVQDYHTIQKLIESFTLIFNQYYCALLAYVSDLVVRLSFNDEFISWLAYQKKKKKQATFNHPTAKEGPVLDIVLDVPEDLSLTNEVHAKLAISEEDKAESFEGGMLEKIEESCGLGLETKGCDGPLDNSLITIEDWTQKECDLNGLLSRFQRIDFAFVCCLSFSSLLQLWNIIMKTLELLSSAPVSEFASLKMKCEEAAMGFLIGFYFHQQLIITIPQEWLIDILYYQKSGLLHLFHYSRTIVDTIHLNALDYFISQAYSMQDELLIKDSFIHQGALLSFYCNDKERKDKEAMISSLLSTVYSQRLFTYKKLVRAIIGSYNEAFVFQQWSLSIHRQNLIIDKVLASMLTSEQEPLLAFSNTVYLRDMTTMDDEGHQGIYSLNEKGDHKTLHISFTEDIVKSLARKQVEIMKLLSIVKDWMMNEKREVHPICDSENRTELQGLYREIFSPSDNSTLSYLSLLSLFLFWKGVEKEKGIEIQDEILSANIYHTINNTFQFSSLQESTLISTNPSEEKTRGDMTMLLLRRNSDIKKEENQFAFEFVQRVREDDAEVYATEALFNTCLLSCNIFSTSQFLDDIKTDIEAAMIPPVTVRGDAMDDSTLPGTHVENEVFDENYEINQVDLLSKLARDELHMVSLLYSKTLLLMTLLGIYSKVITRLLESTTKDIIDGGSSQGGLLNTDKQKKDNHDSDVELLMSCEADKDKPVELLNEEQDLHNEEHASKCFNIAFKQYAEIFNTLAYVLETMKYVSNVSMDTGKTGQLMKALYTSTLSFVTNTCIRIIIDRFNVYQCITASGYSQSQTETQRERVIEYFELHHEILSTTATNHVTHINASNDKEVAENLSGLYNSQSEAAVSTVLRNLSHISSPLQCSNYVVDDQILRSVSTSRVLNDMKQLSQQCDVTGIESILSNNPLSTLIIHYKNHIRRAGIIPYILRTYSTIAISKITQYLYNIYTSKTRLQCDLVYQALYQYQLQLSHQILSLLMSLCQPISVPYDRQHDKIKSYILNMGIHMWYFILCGVSYSFAYEEHAHDHIHSIRKGVLSSIYLLCNNIDSFSERVKGTSRLNPQNTKNEYKIPSVAMEETISLMQYKKTLLHGVILYLLSSNSKIHLCLTQTNSLYRYCSYLPSILRQLDEINRSFHRPYPFDISSLSKPIDIKFALIKSCNSFFQILRPFYHPLPLFPKLNQGEVQESTCILGGIVSESSIKTDKRDKDAVSCEVSANKENLAISTNLGENGLVIGKSEGLSLLARDVSASIVQAQAQESGITYSKVLEDVTIVWDFVQKLEALYHSRITHANIIYDKLALCDNKNVYERFFSCLDEFESKSTNENIFYYLKSCMIFSGMIATLNNLNTDQAIQARPDPSPQLWISPVPSLNLRQIFLRIIRHLTVVSTMNDTTLQATLLSMTNDAFTLKCLKGRSVMEIVWENVVADLYHNFKISKYNVMKASYTVLFYLPCNVMPRQQFSGTSSAQSTSKTLKQIGEPYDNSTYPLLSERLLAFVYLSPIRRHLLHVALSSRVGVIQNSPQPIRRLYDFMVLLYKPVDARAFFDEVDHYLDYYRVTLHHILYPSTMRAQTCSCPFHNESERALIQGSERDSIQGTSDRIDIPDEKIIETKEEENETIKCTCTCRLCNRSVKSIKRVLEELTVVLYEGLSDIEVFVNTDYLDTYVQHMSLRTGDNQLRQIALWRLLTLLLSPIQSSVITLHALKKLLLHLSTQKEDSEGFLLHAKNYCQELVERLEKLVTFWNDVCVFYVEKVTRRSGEDRSFRQSLALIEKVLAYVSASIPDNYPRYHPLMVTNPAISFNSPSAGSSSVDFGEVKRGAQERSLFNRHGAGMLQLLHCHIADLFHSGSALPVQLNSKGAFKCHWGGRFAYKEENIFFSATPFSPRRYPEKECSNVTDYTSYLIQCMRSSFFTF